MQSRAARCGASVRAYDPHGHEIVGSVGELVIDQPLPSMPLTFYGPGGAERYQEAYFEDYPGVWRHGDWITIGHDGTCVVSGRSDATLNRGGVRLGTADFYAVVESFSYVEDSLVIHLDGEEDLLLLFVDVAGDQLDEDQRKELCSALRRQLSPRHVPDRIIEVSQIPRTLTGKKVEVPVKRILRGAPADLVVAAAALANPESIPAFVDLAPGLLGSGSEAKPETEGP